MKRRSSPFFSGAAVMFLGIVVGALGMRAYDLYLARQWLRQDLTTRRSALVEGVLTRRLDLDEDQARQMHALVRSQEEDFDALVEETRPERERLRQELVEGARTFLRADQQRELEAIAQRVRDQEGF